jgi:uncharacterized Tic20 family protein
MQPNASAPPPQPSDSSDKLLAILCHLSFLFGLGFILPLVVYLVKRNESVFVRSHASEVLNFHLSIMIYAICAFILIFVLIGIPLLILIGLFAFVCAIIGAVKASNNEFYFYPLTVRFIN